MSETRERALSWIIGTDTGLSSRTIWQFMMGADAPEHEPWPNRRPSDPSDFGRCYRLLKLIPEWRERLPEMAEAIPEWGPLVREWDRFTEMYEAAVESKAKYAAKLYEAMKENEAECLIAGGWVERIPGSWRKAEVPA